MKKPFWNVLMVVAVLVLAVACTREPVQPETTSARPQGAANCPDRAQFVAGKTYREYLTDYRQLPPPKKKCMWEDKLAHSLQFFNDEGQRSFITQSTNLLTIQRFAQGNPEGFEDNFMAQAKLLFTFEQIARVFFVLHDYDKPPLPMVPNNSGGQGGAAVNNDCECYYSIYCGVMGVCVSGNCGQVGGCGVFGSTNCRGLCEL